LATLARRSGVVLTFHHQPRRSTDAAPSHGQALARVARGGGRVVRLKAHPTAMDVV